MSINDFFHVVEEVFDFIESFGGGVGVFPRYQILHRHAEGLGDFVRLKNVGCPRGGRKILNASLIKSTIERKTCLCCVFGFNQLIYAIPEIYCIHTVISDKKNLKKSFFALTITLKQVINRLLRLIFKF